jgi:hypothetical protein
MWHVSNLPVCAYILVIVLLGGLKGGALQKEIPPSLQRGFVPIIYYFTYFWYNYKNCSKSTIGFFVLKHSHLILFWEAYIAN